MLHSSKRTEAGPNRLAVARAYPRKPDLTQLRFPYRSRKILSVYDYSATVASGNARGNARGE